MSGALKGGAKKVRAIRNIDTGFSRTFKTGKTSQAVRLDPSIRDLENEGIENTRSLFTAVEGLPDAVIGPLRRRLEKARAETARGFGRRGISGSLARSFIGGQEREDETALTEALAKVNFQVGDFKRALGNDLRLSKLDRTQRELSVLGVGQNIGQQVLQAQIANAQQSTSRFNAVAGIAGRGLTAAGTLG